eukprot:756323-Hanusia_phi.AAC.7
MPGRLQGKNMPPPPQRPLLAQPWRPSYSVLPSYRISSLRAPMIARMALRPGPAGASLLPLVFSPAESAGRFISADTWAGNSGTIGEVSNLTAARLPAILPPRRRSIEYGFTSCHSLATVRETGVYTRPGPERAPRRLSDFTRACTVAGPGSFLFGQGVGDISAEMLTRRRTKQPPPFKAGRDQKRVKTEAEEFRDLDDISSERSTPRKRKYPAQPVDVNQEVDLKLEAPMFRVHDLVWAKMKGSGPWPGKIVTLEEEKVKVEFFRGSSEAFAIHELTPYSERNSLKFPSKKTQKFLNAVKEAEEAMNADQDVKEQVTDEKENPLGEEAAEVDDDESHISEYEKLRRANMDRNNSILQTLQIPDVSTFMPAESSVAGRLSRVRGLKSNRAAEALPQRERSLRLQGKKPDGESMGLPADWREPTRLRPVMFDLEDQYERREGDIAVSKCKIKPRNSTEEEAEEDLQKTLAVLERVKSLSFPSEQPPADGDGTRMSQESYISQLKSLTVADKDMAKVVPEKISSMAIHPDEENVIVACGDKKGNIGIFTPDWSTGDDCVSSFRVHSSAVKWLDFNSLDCCLYSASYENIIRRFDLSHMSFMEVLRLDEDDDAFIASATFRHDRNSIVCGLGGGSCLLFDRRKPEENTVQLHNKTIRSVAIHPCNDFLLMTSSVDCSMKLWDIRKLKAKQHLMELTHGAGVVSATFSRSGKFAASLSWDNTIRIIDPQSYKELHKIQHNNQTGERGGGGGGGGGGGPSLALQEGGYQPLLAPSIPSMKISSSPAQWEILARSTCSMLRKGRGSGKCRMM